MTKRKIAKGRAQRKALDVRARQGFHEVRASSYTAPLPTVSPRHVADVVLLHAQACLQALGRVPSLTVKVRGRRVLVETAKALLLASQMQAFYEVAL